MPFKEVVEGDDFTLPLEEGERLRAAVERLQGQLRASFSLLSERAGAFRLRNVIGTIDLGAGFVIQVSPKVPVGVDWTTAVVSLLTGNESIEIAGERPAGTSPLHNRLLDAVANIYLSRLERAYRQEGPIMLMERFSADLPNLQGKLDVTKWARSALWRPHIFPVVRTRLDPDNPFTRGLVFVADTLAHVASNPQTRSGLHVVARDLSAGMALNGALTPGAASRILPEQWSAYKPAWSLATAVLSKTSLLGPTGRHAGVGLAIEAWPLLETLLERTLQSIQRVGRRSGRNFAHLMQGSVRLLEPTGPRPQAAFLPQPDGLLFEDGRLVANFEAKYKTFDGTAPTREDTYQTLTTARACGSRLAVLVYPNTFKPQVWEVSGFHGVPSHLVAVGLDLFSWLPASVADTRGDEVLKVIDGLTKAIAAPDAVGAAA